ncbi:hypothetical protein CAL7102_07572 [Dulcicalothrix desertica PCC 7102]|nr:hypothetical protein CAL7102_07572 [Dulcicalothrix desertica PCC 7102]
MVKISRLSLIPSAYSVPDERTFLPLLEVGKIIYVNNPFTEILISGNETGLISPSTSVISSV